MPLRALNPFDQSVVCRLPWDKGSALERKIESAARAQEKWKRLPLSRRISDVRAGVSRLRSRREKIAREVSLQMGKPLAQARREVDTSCARADHMLSIARPSLAPDILGAERGFHLRIEHEPLGLVLDIAAWNYPLLIPINVVVPALLSGNLVLLKHSGRTPLCGKRFEDAFGPLVTSVVLTHDDTLRLVDDPRIRYVAFTGSVEGGRRVYERAARRGIGVGLELGGKDPAYVAADADLDFTAAGVVDGACYNAGQSCCSVERAYVHRKLYGPFLRKAEALMRAYVTGDPLEETTTLGPLADRAKLEVLERRVARAVRGGARLILGGRRLPHTRGNFFPPTLLADVPNREEIMQEESFGPVLPVRAVSGDDEALALMSDTRFGLTASIWTKSRERAERISRGLDAGTIYQNRCDYLDPRLAWTGSRDSGIGATLSRYGFLHLTRLKSIHFRA